MKYGVLVCVIFSIILSVITFSITASDMRQWKNYESYCDDNGAIQRREIENTMYHPNGGIFSQYWQFHGLKQGIYNWIQISSYYFIPLYLAVCISLFLSRKQSKTI